MNGKQAKRLRKLACEKHEDVSTSYRDYYPPYYETRYLKDEEGEDILDMPIGHVKTRPGTPRYLNDCARREYKDMKDPNRISRREFIGK